MFGLPNQPFKMDIKGGPRSLLEMALSVAIDNIHLIDDMGDLPEQYSQQLLRHVKSAARLREIELNSPHLDTTEHWQRLIRQDFRLLQEKHNFVPKNPKSWHKVYIKYKGIQDEQIQNATKRLEEQLAAHHKQEQKSTTPIISGEEALRMASRRRRSFDKDGEKKKKSVLEEIRKAAKKEARIFRVKRPDIPPTRLNSAPISMINQQIRKTYYAEPPVSADSSKPQKIIAPRTLSGKPNSQMSQKPQANNGAITICIFSDDEDDEAGKAGGGSLFSDDGDDEDDLFGDKFVNSHSLSKPTSLPAKEGASRSGTSSAASPATIIPSCPPASSLQNGQPKKSAGATAAKYQPTGLLAAKFRRKRPSASSGTGACGSTVVRKTVAASPPAAIPSAQRPSTSSAAGDGSSLRPSQSTSVFPSPPPPSPASAVPSPNGQPTLKHHQDNAVVLKPPSKKPRLE